MAKPPRPSVVEKIKAKLAAAAPLSLDLSDLGNLVFAARRALGAIGGTDLTNVTNSIVRAEAVLEAATKAQAPAAPTQPAEKPAEPAKG